MRAKMFKYFLITLTLCWLSSSVCGARLSDINTDLAQSTEIDANTTAAAAATKKYLKTKISARDDNEEDYDNEEQDEDITSHDETEMAEKTAIQPAEDETLSIWDMLSGFWNWFSQDTSEKLSEDDRAVNSAIGEGRTFGKIRRLQMALIPIVFKFGVLSAMITFLVGLGIKTLFLVKVLVLMNLLALLAKFFSLKKNFGHVDHFSAASAPMWSTYGWPSAPEEHHLNKEIHLHIHGGHQGQSQASSYPYVSATTGQVHGWEGRSDPYNAYTNIALQAKQNELMANELPTTVNTIVSKGHQYGRSFTESH